MASVVVLAVLVALAALIVLIVFVALIALIVSVALIVLIVSVALIVFAVVAVDTLNISRFLTKTVIAKVPAFVAGTFLYKVKHMKQVTVHRM